MTGPTVSRKKDNRPRRTTRLCLTPDEEGYGRPVHLLGVLLADGRRRYFTVVQSGVVSSGRVPVARESVPGTGR